MSENEMELLIRSFDADLGESDRQALDRVLDGSAEARAEQERLKRLRRLVADARAVSFEPHFAERVIAGIDDRGMGSIDDRGMAGTDDRGIAGIDDRVVPGIVDTPQAPAASTARAADRRARPYTSRRGAARPARVAAGFAAVAVVVAAVVAFLWLQPKTVTVPYGSVQTVELADGSIVELSSGSRITYSNFIGRDERRVELEGEAFFDVAHAERPFVVETFNASVSVLGTRFNVRAWPQDPIPETAVALASGRVVVESLQPPRDAPEMSEAATQRSFTTVVLEPGQSTSVVRDSTAVREPTFVSLDHVVAWRSGGLAFVDQPVGSVFTAIERRFNVDVEISHPGIQDRLLTYLNPNPASAEEVLSDVCHTLDLRYRRTANGFAILPSSTP